MIRSALTAICLTLAGWALAIALGIACGLVIHSCSATLEVANGRAVVRRVK